MVIAQLESGKTRQQELPELRPPYLLRHRLLRRLLSTEDSFLLVTGPAGYGKTTLLVQYAHREPRPSVWLCLDEADNDPAVFLDRLWDALANNTSVDPDLVPVE